MSATTVAPEDARALRAIENFYRERRCGTNDQRPSEQRVRTQRHEQHRVDTRPHDRTAGGKRVCGRTGRRRHDNTVAAEGRKWSAIHLDDDFEHPLAAGLLDRRLVERPGLVDDFGVDFDANTQRHALFDLVVAGENATDSRR